MRGFEIILKHICETAFAHLPIQKFAISTLSRFITFKHDPETFVLNGMGNNGSQTHFSANHSTLGRTVEHLRPNPKIDEPGQN